MSVVLLVRHGQASFGSDDYDRLSPQGIRQSRTLGAWLQKQGLDPVGGIVSGGMRRQRETADAMVDAGGWAHDVRVDPAWDEFDLMSFTEHRVEGAAATDSRAFQGVLEDGMRRWSDGVVLDEAAERFSDFAGRIEGALQWVVSDQPGSGPVVVTTSAGVISWLATSLLGGGVEQWILLNRVCVNAGVTKIVSGRGGLSLVSFNEHGHLAPAETTYR